MGSDSSKDKNKISDNNQLKESITNKVLKSLCKIIPNKNNNKKNIYGIGFFMKVSNSLKYLITNFHVISDNDINEIIEIELYNKKIIKLNKENLIIKSYPEPKKYITIIRINNLDDKIFEDISFLYYDNSFINNDYNIYKNKSIFAIQKPFEENNSFIIGKIIDVNKIKFEHDLPLDDYSVGCPIILLNKNNNENNNEIKVIGIQKKVYHPKKLKKGIFIGEIFNYNNLQNNNYIIAEFDIKEKNINKEIRILSCYEKNISIYDIVKEKRNEREIKNCEIEINNELIKPFDYFYKFKNKGKYIIKYKFNNYITKSNYMFSKCDTLIKIDLSNFNTQNIIDMEGMFNECKSLANIILSNITTENVTDMSLMFKDCESLVDLDLSNFNTNNVNNMTEMFSGCHSLLNINLSNFNTENVIEMARMFYFCGWIKNIDLSNFNTKKVTNMNSMFSECSSLKKLNILNFDFRNINDMDYILHGCKNLDKNDIIAEDGKIYTYIRGVPLDSLSRDDYPYD